MGRKYQRVGGEPFTATNHYSCTMCGRRKLVSHSALFVCTWCDVPPEAVGTVGFQPKLRGGK